MTDKTLMKAKMVASHLNSAELSQLSEWASSMSNKKYREEGIAKTRAYEIGTKLVLGNVNGFPQFSGQVVQLTAHGRKLFVVHLLNEDGSVNLAKGLKIPYVWWGSVKGQATPENISTAKSEVEISQTLAPVLNQILLGVKN